MGKYIKNKTLNIGKSDEETKNIFDEILRFIYEQFPLDHDKMKVLYEHIKVPVDFDDEYDNDYEYNYYYRRNLKFVNHYIKDDDYIYEFNKDICLGYYENDKLINELHSFLLENSPKKLCISNFKTITLTNNNGVNHDARGVKFMDWKLYFWNSYPVGKDLNITLHDLIIAAYKIRSHKFENHYELFCGIENLHIKNGHLFINTCFDHGS